VLEVRGEQVRLGISADRSISIHRKELLTRPPEEETPAPDSADAPAEPPDAASETASEPPQDAAPPAEEPEEAGQPEEAEVTMVGSRESLPEFDLDLPDEQPAEAAAPSGPRLQDASNPALAYPISPEGAAIGRRSGQDIVIENPYVSSSHAAIAVQDGEYTLTDIGSTNGTVVNGETLPPNEPRVLADGDEISFGPVKLVFRKGEAEAI